MIDESQTKSASELEEMHIYMTVGRTKTKIKLDGSLVYNFDVWVGDQVGQEARLGMDFMVPAGIRLDLADKNYVYQTRCELVWQDGSHLID